MTEKLSLQYLRDIFFRPQAKMPKDYVPEPKPSTHNHSKKSSSKARKIAKASRRKNR